MKKLAYLAGLGCALCMLYACEDEPKNPGRFDVAAELSLSDKIISLTDSTLDYTLEVAEIRDTTYARQHVKNDTVFRFLENGDSVYVYGEDGKPLINKDTVIILSKKTAKLIEFKPVVFPSYADTMQFQVFSNARWMANDPSRDVLQKITWVENIDGTVQGGGDSKIIICTTRNRARYRGPAYQYVYTSDSMVCARIPLFQVGERDK